MFAVEGASGLPTLQVTESWGQCCWDELRLAHDIDRFGVLALRSQLRWKHDYPGVAET